MNNSRDTVNDKVAQPESSSSSYGQISNSDEEKKKSDTDSSLERSFELIGSSEGQPDNVNTGLESSEAEISRKIDHLPSPSKIDHPAEFGSLIQRKLKNSSSFFVRSLQTPKDDNQDAPRKTSIPSSFASALSSMSSLTSSFSNTNHNHPNMFFTSNSGTSLTVETSSNVSKFNHTIETKEEIFLKKAAMERKNLINLTKLIVKDLISSHLTVTRTVDDCNSTHLKNYFVLIERVLKHGLKDNVFSGRSSNLWNILENLQKYMNESTLIAESIRSLTNTKTPDGKVRAWMRLAMMQKKLPEYFNELLANKDVLLKNSYHDFAFILNDEANIFAGLLIGVNVIDCNFFIKESNFDLMDDVIDLSPYLRNVNGFETDTQQDNSNVLTCSDANDKINNSELKSVLDQKNYLEEWNKRLEGTIVDLQRKIKQLEESNSKLEMEAKLTEAQLSKLNLDDKSLHHESTSVTSSITGAIKSMMRTSDPLSKSASGKLIENASIASDHQVDAMTIKSDQELNDDSQTLLTRTLGMSTSSPSQQQDNLIGEQASCYDESMISRKESDEAIQAAIATTEKQYKTQITELEKVTAKLQERTSILETSYRSSLEKVKILEADLDVQTSMNADKETTIRIYEKDIREKQVQVDNLRNSLNDAKTLNTSLTERFNEIGVKLKERVKMVTSLQTSLDKWKLENKNMATRLQEKAVQLKAALSDLEKANKTIDDLKQYNIRVTDDLKNERESGQCSTFTLETRQKKIDDLTEKVKELSEQLKSISPYEIEAKQLRQKCLEYEQSLEEMGTRLKESRLEIDSLKENSALFTECQWMDDKQVKECNLCLQIFSVTRRKHHCRLCGNVFCQTCSDNKMELASSSKPARVCDTCHSFLLAKFVKSAN